MDTIRVMPRTKAPYILGLETGQEHPDPVRLAITGTIPDWLAGVLLRTAPARFEVGRTQLTHWFDGHAMLHRFEIGRGQVTYRSRYLESATASEAKAAGELVIGEFGTDPSRTLFEQIATIVSPIKFTDNCNVNVMVRGESVVALTETPLRWAFDPETLHVDRLLNDAAEIAGQITTAHPLHDPSRSTIYSYLLHLGIKSSCKLVATDDRSGVHKLLTEFAMDHPPYMHSFGMSENYIIMAMPPFVVDPLALKLSGKPFIHNYHWRPELGLRFYIIDKRDGRVVTQAQTAAAFLFHHVNAFEEDGAIMVDLLVFPDADIISRLDLERMRALDPTSLVGELRRYRIAIASGMVTSAPLSATEFEFPRINHQQVGGRSYRFVYGAGSLSGDMNDCIVKVDVTTGNTVHWTGAGLYAGEPVFVPQPQRSEEDAGLLLSVVLDVEARSSFLVVLDAVTLAEYARALVPQAITLGFHGNFLPR